MTTPAVTPLRTFRMLVGALMGALVVIGVALAFVVHGARNRDGHTVHTHAPGADMYIVIVAVGLVAAVVVQIVGYRVRPVPAGTDPAAAAGLAVRTFQQGLFLRFALSEAVALVALVLLFVGRSNSVLPYVVGAVIAEALMAHHVWPGPRVIERVQQRLDRDGGSSDLANALNGTA